jgi:hypothetical protein
MRKLESARREQERDDLTSLAEAMNQIRGTGPGRD